MDQCSNVSPSQPSAQSPAITTSPSPKIPRHCPAFPSQRLLFLLFPDRDFLADLFPPSLCLFPCHSTSGIVYHYLVPRPPPLGSANNTIFSRYLTLSVDIMNSMDTNMEDVKMPELQQMPQSPIEPTTTATLDSWIAGLLDCKQLAEKDVQRLCEKVQYSFA
jgi:hypothetical protein